jgi:hypothetical protein
MTSHRKPPRRPGIPQRRPRQRRSMPARRLRAPSLPPLRTIIGFGDNRILYFRVGWWNTDDPYHGGW